MSNSAITWAFSADVRRSADKLILVCLANHANEDGLCWPSQAKLIEQTSLDRKTVIASLKRLAESGWLQDTGRRRGQSGQVPIIQLVLTRVSEPRRFVRDEDMQSEIPGKSSVFPAPPTPSDSPEIPARESQFSREGVPFFPPGGPKNGIRKPHRTLIEPTMNPHCTPPLGDLLMALNGDETAPGEDSPRPSDPKPEKPPKRAKARTRIPDNWWPDEAGLTFAQQRSVLTRDEVPRMIAYHQQNGNLMADWSAAWRTWCLNQVRFRERDTKARQGGNRFTNGRPRPASPREAMEIILGRSFSPEPPPHDGPTIDMNPEEYAYHG